MCDHGRTDEDFEVNGKKCCGHACFLEKIMTAPPDTYGLIIATNRKAAYRLTIKVATGDRTYEDL